MESCCLLKNTFCYLGYTDVFIPIAYFRVYSSSSNLSNANKANSILQFNSSTLPISVPGVVWWCSALMLASKSYMVLCNSDKASLSREIMGLKGSIEDRFTTDFHLIRQIKVSKNKSVIKTTSEMYCVFCGKYKQLSSKSRTVFRARKAMSLGVTLKIGFIWVHSKVPALRKKTM